MLVGELDTGCIFKWAGRTMIKVSPAYKEKLQFVVDYPNCPDEEITIDSEDCAAVDTNSGELFFVTDEVEVTNLDSV